MPMNVLFLMGVYPGYGGVEKVSTILANEFVNKGIGVSIVSFEQPFPELAKEELNPNIKLYKLDFPVNTKANRITLSRIIREKEIYILINQWCVPYYVTRLCRQAMKGTSCKLIAVHHNLPNTNARIKDIEIAIEQKRGNRAINLLKLFTVKTISRLSLRYVYEKSDRYILLSPSFIPLVKKFIWKRDSRKMLSIFNPITIDVSNKNDIAKQNEIIYVGRIEDNQKRTFRLVEIWKELEPLFPEWHFRIVGDGPDRQKLENNIKEQELKKISIEGFKDPLPYYKRASILLLTSEYEGFPLVIGEGMTYGVIPVVLGSYTAVHDIIDNGRSGIISPYPYSKDTFVHQLMDLMGNQELRKRMARDAVQASRKFEREAIVKEWMNLFQQLHNR